jgi:FkbM family methyltransferase
VTVHILGAQERWYADHIPLRGQVVADVGANVGRFSQFFWDASGGTSRVVSIEPLTENVAAIRERIRAAGAERWSVQACAVSARAGSVGLAVARSPDGGWNSAVVARGGARQVRCLPLSRLVPDATVVKLDIEGHEYGVLDEALARLARAHTWALELHQVPERPLQRALGAFQAEGYRLIAASRDPRAPQAWASTEISATLDWEDIPPAKVRADGRAFRMLHVIAQRLPEAA